MTRLPCNAMGIEHDAHEWEFGSGETFRCPGDPDGFTANAKDNA